MSTHLQQAFGPSLPATQASWAVVGKSITPQKPLADTKSRLLQKDAVIYLRARPAQPDCTSKPFEEARHAAQTLCSFNQCLQSGLPYCVL